MANTGSDAALAVAAAASYCSDSLGGAGDLPVSGGTGIIEQTDTKKDGGQHGGQLAFNLGWFAAAMTTGLAYVYSPMARSIAFPDRWYDRFLLLYCPFLLVQTVLHWLFLNRFFPDERRRNIYRAAFMPVILIAGFTLVLYVSLYRVPWPT